MPENSSVIQDFFMQNMLFVTIIFIALATIIGAFVRRRHRDKCLKDFANNLITLEQTSGKTIQGRLNVENTGLEFIYPAKHHDENGHDRTSCVLYKHEYPNIQVLLRFHNQLSEPNKIERTKELKKTYHPGFFRRLKRKIQNFFKTVRDSIMEIVNLLISHAQKTTPAGTVLSKQSKYVSQMKQELMGSMGASFEPLLEKYIGRRVILELIEGEKIHNYSGVLKDYTAQFIEIMDVDYQPPPPPQKEKPQPKEQTPPQKADLIVLRKYGIIRHLAE